MKTAYDASLVLLCKGLLKNTFYKDAFFLFFFFSGLHLFAQPSISSFTPTSGPVGTTVTISGTGFGSTPASNIVYFGAVKASITAASTTSLTVSVPLGATYQPITITTNYLTAYSSKPFVVTFQGGGNVTPGTFDKINRDTTDLHPNGVAMADFDGDGKPDLATPNNYSTTGSPASVSILKNTSSKGTISFARRSDINTGVLTYAIAAGDLNGDGKPDLVSSSIADKTISVFKNTSTVGNISFASKIDYATGDNPTSIAIGDLDGDGKPDIAVSNNFSNTVSIYKNTSNGTALSFSPKIDFTTALKPHSLAIGDLDGDKKADLIVTNELSFSFSILRNISSSGNMLFSSRADNTCGSGNKPTGVSIADLNGDDQLDIIIVIDNDNGSAAQIFKNTSTSAGNISVSFATSVSNDRYSTAYHAGIGDINGDGKADIAIGVTYPGQVTVFQNNSTTGGFSFSPGVNFIDAAPYSIVIGDLDSDGKSDMSAANFIHDWISTFRNKSTEPSIASFTPQNAKSGDTVTISGYNFTGSTGVSFGGVPALFFSVINPTTIMAVIGTGASGDVIVTGPNGTGTLNGFVHVTPPSITSFTPDTGGNGTNITIRGTYFQGATAVKFGGTDARSFTVISTTTITATVGAGTSGNVSVTTQFGTATLTGFTYIGSPVISSFSPASAASGNVVTIIGTNLSRATAINFGGTPAASFTVIDDNTIKAVVAQGTSGNISVTTSFGTGARAGFIYIPPPPVIQSFSPSSGIFGALVTIKGTYFTGTTAVSFGGVAVSSFTVQSDNSIVATVANGATGDVSITTPSGTAALAGFTFLPPPVITSFTPDSAGRGITVTILGSNFTGTTDVRFGGVPATSFVVHSATKITAVIGSGSDGNVFVATLYGNTSKPGFTYIPKFEVYNYSPKNAGNGTVVTIEGRKLEEVTAVHFGGMLAASFKVLSTNTISAVVGNGASGSVSVMTAKDTISLPGFNFFLPPVITSFSPTVSGNYEPIVITGANFIGATKVTIGESSIPFTVESPNKILTRANYPSGNISVTTPGGTATSGWFTYVQAPLAQSFTPKIGGKGTVVTLIGGDYTYVTGVTFGGKPAASFTVHSANKITAVVGEGASGPVQVFNPAGGGGYSLPGFTFTESLLINSFSPATAGPSTIVTITGANFENITSVSFGGVPAKSFTVHSPTTITAIADSGSSGTVRVTTSTDTTELDGFKYTQAPYITSISPDIGGAGTIVTIKGINFTGVTSVSFGDIAATSFKVDSTSGITAVIGAGATGKIAVTSAQGTGTINGFTFTNRPVVQSFVPTSGPVGSTVTIRGANFSSVITDNIVYFGAVKAAIVEASANRLTVRVPLGATYQPLSVTTGRLTGYSAQPFLATFPAKGSLSSNSFTAKIDSVSGFNPVWASIGDLDEDGKPDIAVANFDPYVYNNSSISIFRNTGSAGTISFAPKSNFVHNKLPSQISLGDLNGDGKLDLAAANGSDGRAVSVFANTGTSGKISFGPELSLDDAISDFKTCIGDFEGDGKPDIFAIGFYAPYTKRYSIFKNISSANTLSFEHKREPITINYPSGLAMADVDMDGKPDILITNISEISSIHDSITILRNTSSEGIPSFATVSIPSEKKPAQIAVGDLDGDGMPDMAIAIPHTNSVSVFRNTSTPGNISYARRKDYATGSGPYGIAIGDLDGDGKPDIAITNVFSNTVSLFNNTSVAGNISFTPKIDFVTGEKPWHVSIGDINGDEKPDLVITNKSSQTISILKNVIPEAVKVTACSGESKTLVSNVNGTAYQWQVKAGGNFINITEDSNYKGTSTASLQLKSILSSWNGNQYKCIVGSDTSAVFSLYVQTSTIPEGTAKSPSNVCAGTSFTITFTSTNTPEGSSVQLWESINGATFIAGPSQTFIGAALNFAVTNNNNTAVKKYFFTITPPTSISCSFANNSDTTTTSIEQLVTPIVILKNNTITITNPTIDAAYLWQLQNASGNWNNITPVAIGLFYSAAVSGFYRVQMEKYGCTEFSNVVAVAVVTPGQASGNEWGIYLYPNPTQGILTLDSLKLTDEWETLDILSMNGSQKLVTFNIKNQAKVTVHLESLGKGMYIALLRRRSGAPAAIRFLKM